MKAESSDASAGHGAVQDYLRVSYWRLGRGLAQAFLTALGRKRPCPHFGLGLVNKSVLFEGSQ